jgi:hypothetical protein
MLTLDRMHLSLCLHTAKIVLSRNRSEYFILLLYKINCIFIHICPKQ